MIVGIDPGLSVGYAALDLDGKLAGAGVVKHRSADRIVGMVSQIGVPLLVACDVCKAPHFVKTVARRFCVKVFCPSKNLTQEQKQFMTCRAMQKTALDPHIRDAYAAALKAYRRYANRFRRIDAIYPEKSEEYKRLVLEGKAVGKAAGKAAGI